MRFSQSQIRSFIDFKTKMTQGGGSDNYDAGPLEGAPAEEDLVAEAQMRKIFLGGAFEGLNSVVNPEDLSQTVPGSAHEARQSVYKPNMLRLRDVIKTSGLSTMFESTMTSIMKAITGEGGDQNESAGGGGAAVGTGGWSADSATLAALEFCEQLARQQLASDPLYGRILTRSGKILVVPSMLEEDATLDAAVRRQQRMQKLVGSWAHGGGPGVVRQHGSR